MDQIPGASENSQGTSAADVASHGIAVAVSYKKGRHNGLLRPCFMLCHSDMLCHIVMLLVAIGHFQAVVAVPLPADMNAFLGKIILFFWLVMVGAGAIMYNLAGNCIKVFLCLYQKCKKYINKFITVLSYSLRSCRIIPLIY